MSDYRVVAVGEKDIIIGFRGLGFDLFPVVSREDTEALLKRLSVDPDLALILITESAAAPCLDIISYLRDKSNATFLIIPSHEGSSNVSMAEMRRYIERAAGINILDKRKEA